MARAQVGKPGESAMTGGRTRAGAAPRIAVAALALMAGVGCRGLWVADADPHPPAGDALLSAPHDAGTAVKTAGNAGAGEAVLASGLVAFDDDLVAHVTSPVGGRVTRVLVRPGRRVAKGAPLAVIVSPELAHAVPDKLKAEADLAAAEGESQRQRQLFDAHEGVTDRLEAARAGLVSARAEVARARAKVALVKGLGGDEMTGSFTVFAPLGGVVLAGTAAPGDVVVGEGAGGGAAELFTVGTLDRVWVIVRISEEDLARIRVGARVTVRAAALPGETFAGRVGWISVPGTSGEAAVRCAVANPKGALKPGMAATVAVAAAARATAWGA